MGQYQTFVVRIWTDGTPRSTRGHIQHIASRRGKYFRDEEKMIRFIREFLEPAALPTVGEARDVPTSELTVHPEDPLADEHAGSM